MLERGYGYVVSVVLLGAMLYPLQTEPQRDSFPLSTYPMFSIARPAFIEIGHVVGVGADDQRRPLPPELVASGEVLQAKVAILATIQRGRRAVRDLCAEVSARIASDPSLSWVVWVEVRTDRYQVAGYFSGAKQPLSGRLHARCKVPREGAAR